jgi:uncharacterized protein YbjT (DUF2867 family)
MSKTAIILGASGLTGSILLEKLLKDERYTSIKLFGRKKLEIDHEKVQQHVVDLFELENHADIFNADEVFCCIGTTKKKTPDRETYRKIDFGIPVTAAKLCKVNGIDTFAVISSIGAKPSGSNFYLKTKGQMEQAAQEQKIPNTIILRPSLIVGDRKEKRGGEKFSIVMMRLFNPLMFGGMKKYRSINAETIIEAMIALANSDNNQQIFESDEIQSIVDESQPSG